MSRRVFLHVGSPKSGTTFLQGVLWSHRELLRDRGVLLPGPNIRAHFHACIDVREEPHLLRDPQVVTGAWDALAKEIRDWDGDAVVSHELFAPATAEQAERALAKLGDAEVHVLVTARDLLRQVPAEWQEHLKHRSTSTFPEFLDQTWHTERGPFSPNGYWFWHVQDIPGVLQRWGRSLPRERVHVVTVPPPDASPDLLWRRFAGLVGVDDRGFDLTRARANPSLRAEQAELLRRLNLQLGDRLPLPGPYPETVKVLLAHQLLAGRPGTRFGLVGDDQARAVERAEQIVAGLKRFDVDVVGDLDELVPQRGDAGEEVSGDAAVDGVAVLEEGVEALAGVLDRLAGERAQRVQLRSRLEASLRDVQVERDRLVHDMQYRPVRHLLIGQSMRRPWLGRVRERYWRIVAAARGVRRRGGTPSTG